MNDLAAKIEGFLFAYGEAIPFADLARALAVPAEDVRAAVRELASHYAASRRGLVLVEENDRVQLGAHPDLAEPLNTFFHEDLTRELTAAALETLAIIAYRAPISRPAIDAIRGVNSSFMLRNLLVRGLVEREPDQKRRNLWLYRPSFECLRLLGIGRKEELPKFEELSKRLDEIEGSATAAGETA